MKYPLILLLLLLLCPLSAQEDSLNFRRLQFGAVGGYLLHEVDFTPNATVLSVPGIHYGLALRYFDKQLVGFQAELIYAQAGWQQEYAIENQEPEIYERLTEYAELQLLTQFSIGRGVVQPMIQAGPYLSVPLGETETLPPSFDPAEEADNTYLGRELPFRVNYGLRAGVGLNLEVGPLTLQVEGRLLQGFSSLIKAGESEASLSVRKAYGGQVGVFYAIK